ncbi:uncharacterized protein DUF1080 [Chitinophaga niastensis]|uniref:Uncharacterized protein DUF1080 n=1 Tax=Chitinophaga niastensis TaxID=536980 RepID=A0A2P8HU85_CHINA|nr:family 16 glycoside hydrolase [Chitinophaga niastensis]PSL49724.1 uncharacterized protein DUF1080 [Chitinophaga niastensis]
MLRHFIIVCNCLVLLTGAGFAQDLRLVNRTVSKDSIIHFNEQPGAGIAWIKNKQFANGTIEFDVRGKNELQKSFVGIAFHGLNDSTYDAVYFRPFNFTVPEAGRRGHSVQYISLPLYDWSLLRNEHPGIYENFIDPPPNPNKWFHVKIIVASPDVTVMVNGKKCLAVEQLSPRKEGMIGYWTGDGSGGDWKGLKITPDK